MGDVGWRNEISRGGQLEPRERKSRRGLGAFFQTGIVLSQNKEAKSRAEGYELVQS